MNLRFVLDMKRRYRFYFGPFSDRRVGVLLLRKNRRNVILTFTDLLGDVVRSLSSKFLVHDKKKRLAPNVTENLMSELCSTMKLYRVSHLRIVLRITKRFIIKAIERALRANDIGCTFAVDLTPIPHNGLRRKKSRRL